MDVASIAAAAVAHKAAQVQIAVAARMLRMGADAAADAATLLDAARQNFQRFDNLGSGVGGQLDITA